MKKIILCFILLVSVRIFAQKATKNSYYVVLYTIGEKWDTTKQFHEQSYFNEHSAYLSKLRKEKIIVMGSRYSDTGMLVINAKDEGTAKAIIDKDIAIQNKLFKTEVYLFEPFYGGCVTESD